MDITYLFIIIGRTEKKNKIKCTEEGGSSNGAKTARDRTKIDLDR